MFSHAFSIIQSRSLVLSACITIRIHPIMPPCLCVLLCDCSSQPFYQLAIPGLFSVMK